MAPQASKKCGLFLPSTIVSVPGRATAPIWKLFLTLLFLRTDLSKEPAMKNKIKRPLACFSVLFFLSTAADLWVVSDLQAQPACDSAYKSLEDLVVPKPQETNRWCWAAVAEMVMARY